MIFHFSGTTGASLFTAIRESINFPGAFASISRYPNEIYREPGGERYLTRTGAVKK